MSNDTHKRYHALYSSPKKIIESYERFEKRRALSHWKPTEVAKKSDEGKLRADLLPIDALREAIKILGYGANKYGEHNWKNGLEQKRIIAALLRHMFEIMDGNIIDAESQLMHAAHVACNALFLIHYQLKGTGK